MIERHPTDDASNRSDSICGRDKEIRDFESWQSSVPPVKIRIKGTTLGDLVGPYEASIADKRDWARICNSVEQAVNYLGPDRQPDTIFAAEIDYLFSTRPKMQEALRAFWNWMLHMGVAHFNPCVKLNLKNKPHGVELELVED